MHILTVVVLYKRSLEQSQTLVSLVKAFRRQPELLKFLRVLVWDNSPTALADPALAFPFEYLHSGKNVGSSGAYNRAMELAEATGIPWLLLLDQDTTISEEFLPKMLEYSRRLADHPEIAAVVPMLWCRGQLISPRRFGIFSRTVPMPRACHGSYKEQVVAVDSAAMIRVTALRAVGGYNEQLFWLDFGDIDVFAALHRNRRSIYIASDLQLQHSLSCLDYDKDMTPERYRNLLAAEGAFWELYGSHFDRVVLPVRLLARALKQYLRNQNKAFARMSWMAFCLRMLCTKAQRMKTWEERLRHRNLPAVPTGKLAD